MPGAEVDPRPLDRRAFLKTAGLAALGPCLGTLAILDPSRPKADHTLHICRARVELAPGCHVSTTTYNGHFPGPLLQSTVGSRLVIDISNGTERLERVRWHGQNVTEPSLVPPGATRRFEIAPEHAGLSFYHSDLTAAAHLDVGLYGGMAGPLFVASRDEPGRFDREAVLLLKEFEPYLFRTARDCAVGYRLFSVNGRMLGHGDPIRVRAGEHVLLHVLNASATETRRVALAGHSMQVVALDGSPVPRRTTVTTLRLAPAERVSALVAMNNPGVWIFGEVDTDAREHGMGIVFEYAGRAGAPRWHAPDPQGWDYSQFGNDSIPPEPDMRVEMVLARTDAVRGGFNRWTVNGREFSLDLPEPVARVPRGSRCRVQLRNTADVACPLQVPGHRLQLATVDGRPGSGVFKDVVCVGGRRQLEVDFVPRAHDSALLQCTRRLHRDFGLMALMDFV